MDASSGPQPPLPPGALSSGIVSTDITSKFIAAAKTLEPGELVKDGFFTLFESVGALEIGDRKMDSGLLDPGEEFEEQYDVRRALLPEEVLGIIDQLLCHEMAWHLGYPLSQTLFTSVYVEKILMPIPSTIQEAHFIRAHDPASPISPALAVLRAYCVGTLKACSYVLHRIQEEMYYEEEDFVTNRYRRTLLDDIDLEAIQTCIQAARVQLRDAHESVAEEARRALDTRLLMRYQFLEALDKSQHTQEPDLIREPWAQLNTFLDQNKATFGDHGVAVPESFSAKLQRKLASTMPPRPIVQLSLEDGFGHLTRLFQDALEAVDVLNYTDPACLLTFVTLFNSKRPQPLVFVRCLLQSFIFSGMVMLGNKSIRDILDDDLSLVVLPHSGVMDKANDEIEAPHDPRFLVARHMEEFRQKAAPSYLELVRTLCQNRCRVRRMLVHVAMGWDLLHDTAERLQEAIDRQTGEKLGIYATSPVTGALHKGHFLSGWIDFHKVRQMEWIVQLGFELEVYQPDELAGMYWYLHTLALLRMANCDQVRHDRMRRANSSVPSRPEDIPFEMRRFTNFLEFSTTAMVETETTWMLAVGLSRLYTVLQRLGLVKAPPRPYSTDELRYELRMKPFTCLATPELPSYEQFKRDVEAPHTTTDDLLKEAAKVIGNARTLIYDVLTKMDAARSFSAGCHDRWMKRTKDWLKATIAAGVAVSTLTKLVEEAGSSVEAGPSVEAEVTVPPSKKAYHEWWIVPTVTVPR